MVICVSTRPSLSYHKHVVRCILLVVCLLVFVFRLNATLQVVKVNKIMLIVLKEGHKPYFYIISCYACVGL